MATSDKKLYVWDGELYHHYMVRILSSELPSKYARFERRIKNGKISFTDSDLTGSSIRENYTWLENYSDMSLLFRH